MSQSLRFGRYALGVCLVSVLSVLATENRAAAQQGVYITQASARLTKLIDASNKDGYVLKDNAFSIGGGWIKQSKEKWVPMYTVQLVAGKQYRFLAAGDNDAKDVDLDVRDSSGKTVAADDATAAEAVVTYTPTLSGPYTVRIRLYDSQGDVPCVCLGIVMVKK